MCIPQNEIHANMTLQGQNRTCWLCRTALSSLETPPTRLPAPLYLNDNTPTTIPPSTVARALIYDFSMVLSCRLHSPSSSSRRQPPLTARVSSPRPSTVVLALSQTLSSLCITIKHIQFYRTSLSSVTNGILIEIKKNPDHHVLRT